MPSLSSRFRPMPFLLLVGLAAVSGCGQKSSPDEKEDKPALTKTVTVAVSGMT